MSDTRFAILVSCYPVEVIEARRPDVTYDEMCALVDETMYQRDCYRNPTDYHRTRDFAAIFANLRQQIEARLDYDVLATV